MQEQQKTQVFTHNFDWIKKGARPFVAGKSVV